MQVAAPSPSLLRAADLLYDGVGHLLEAREQIDVEYQKYDSSHDALNLLYHSIRHVEAVVELARKDLVMLSAAITSARAALESSMRALWLVDCDNPFEREGRWLGFIAEEVQSRTRAAKRLSSDGHTDLAAENLQVAQELESHRQDVVRLLPAGISQQPLPKFDALLTKTNTSISYAIYMIGSQYTHGTSWALARFRQGLGTKRQFNEIKDNSSWILPLSMCECVIKDTGCRALNRLGAPHGRVLPRNYSAQLHRAIADIKEV
jgi:hypothetical protein